MSNQLLYQALVGSLLYLSTRTRPDIAYAVNSVARYCANPTNDHHTAVKGILRYLNGTHNLGLLYRGDDCSEMKGYSDADWSGDVGDRKSTSGHLYLYAGGAVSWKSSKQSCVALSTAEGEYVTLSAAAQESVWLQQLMSDLMHSSKREMVIFEDNQSAICVAKNQQTSGRMKHIDIKCHYFMSWLRLEGSNWSIAVLNK